MTKKLVTLIIDYDEERWDHPSQWDWSDLIGDVNILRVEVFDAE